ncbi:MAG: AraC family transcriptional regulator [Bacteroidetes bacterium]|nr:MAG: AraC family transcriptional regulator [Bacteroidota bacterium]
MLQVGWIHLLVFTIILTSFLLGGLLCFNPYFRSRANCLLGATFGIIGITSFTYGLLTAGVEAKWAVILNDIMWEYLFPVTLLLYFAHSLSHPLARSPWRYGLYLPFLATLLLNLAIDFALDLEWYEWPWVKQQAQLEAYYFWEQLGLFPFAIACLSWSYFIVRDYPPPVATSWFKRFWLLTTCATGCWMLSMLLELQWQIDLVKLLWGIVGMVVIWTTYQGVLRFKLAEEGAAIRSLLAQRKNAVARQEAPSSTLPSKNYVALLKRKLEDEHWYRDPSLSRDTVAARLGISSGYLSQQFSAHSPEQNFSDLINAYRVAEVQRLLCDPAFASYSILAIGYEAGFNSKSTFYTAFKRVTGLTPSAYRARAMS